MGRRSRTKRKKVEENNIDYTLNCLNKLKHELIASNILKLNDENSGSLLMFDFNNEDIEFLNMIIKYFKEKKVSQSLDLDQIVGILCKMDVTTAYQTFKIIANYIKEYKILIFNDKLGANIPKLRFSTELTNNIIPVTTCDKVLYLNNKSYQDMIKERNTNIETVICCDWDTNYVSYIEKMFMEGSEANVPNVAKQIMEEIYLNKYDFDASPYLFENSYKFGDSNKSFLDTVKVLCLIIENFDKFFENRSKIEKQKLLNEYENKAIDKIRFYKKTEFREYLNTTYLQVYTLVTKAIIINFSTGKSAKNKFIDLLIFLNEEHGFLLIRELVVIYEFYNKNGIFYDFFQKFNLILL
ncbi:MAG: hypothetical protein ACK5K7_00880 [Bacilli bacterium]